MVDFAKIRADRAAALAAKASAPTIPAKSTVPAAPPKPRAVGRSLEEDLANIFTLLDDSDPDALCCLPNEITFLKSLKYQIEVKHIPALSVAQAKWLDDLVKIYIAEEEDKDPTPKGNPPARFAKPMTKSSWSMDDDIPF